MKSVIFCATQRTGSSVIVDDFFNLLGGRAVDAEYLTTELFKLRNHADWNSLWLKVQRENVIRDVVVVKVMLHYIAYISDFINGLSPPKDVTAVLDIDFTRLQPFADFFAQAVWVHVQRRNIAEQAVSVFFAQQTDVWERRSKSDNSPPHEALNYDKARLFVIARELKREASQWTKFFGYFGITPIDLEYNDVLSSYPHYLDELYSRLRLKRADEAPPRRMHKLGDKINIQYADKLRSDYLAEFDISL